MRAIAKRLSVRLATLSSLISKKLETTSTSLTQQADVLTYAENPSQEKVKGIRDLFLTILKSDQDLKAVVLVTKSGQVISTDDSVQMKTSSDMMTEDWYQKAIHQELNQF